MQILSIIVTIGWLLAPAARAAEPAKLEIVKATWTVDGKTTADVTAAIARLVKNDRLDLKVDPARFGGDPVPPKRYGRLTLVYKLGGGPEKTVNLRSGQDVWISSETKEQVQAAQRLPELRKKYPNGLVILSATYGIEGRTKDVTEILQSLVNDDSLTVPVNRHAFEDPAPGRSDKRLRVIYHDGKETKESETAEGGTLQIGPNKLPVLARDGAIVDLRRKLAELRKQRPEGIVVIDARFGANRSQDVTDLVQGAVSGDSLTVPVSTPALGDPAPGSSGKNLRMYYAVGDKIEFLEQGEGTVVQIGPRLTAIAAPGGGLLNLAGRIAELRKKHPAGLLVLYARYGEGNRWRDVTELLQAAVSDDSLTAPVNDDAFGNPAPGAAGKRLQITYAVGEEVKSVEEVEGSTLQIGPKRTAVVAIGGGLTNFQQRVAELRKTRPTGLLVLQARFGEGNRWKDVTELLQSVASDDSLTVPVGDDALGNPAPGAAGKRLQMTYAVGDEIKTIEQGEGSVVQIGPKRTSMVALQGGLINIDERIAELRKDHPDGLLIVESRFGGGNQWMDVTDRVQDAVKGKTLSIKASTDAFGDPNPGQADKNMVTTYFDGEKAVTVTTANGSTLKINGKTVPSVSAGGVTMSNEQRLEAFRKVYGDGLIILDAQYGSGNRWGDVREIAQAAVVNDRLQATVGDGWGDPAPGSTKEVNITYWDGRKIRSVRQAQGSKLDLRGVKPEPLKSLAPPPTFAAAEQKLNHAFGGKGTFALEDGPAGATLSTDGKLAWTPAADQVGMHDLRYSVTVNGKTYVGTARIEVVSREIAKDAGNDLTKLESLLRLELGAGPVSFAPGLGWKTALLLRPDELIVVSGDGTSVRKRAKLAGQYTHVAEREKYFVALSKDPNALELLDKATLKPTKTVKLPYRSLTDLAIHPTMPLCYVAVEEPATGTAQYRVIVVDEGTGDAREPDNLIGRFLAIDPSGARLYTGYKDIYQRGVRLFMNPDGRIWDTPEYGNIDILMVYDLRDVRRPKLQEYKERAGGNGAGLRVSPDGKRLTYLSHVGYPVGSGAIPGWDPTDLEKKPVTFECKGKAGATRMSYHPTLPLVAVPAESGVLLFHRETGEEEKDRVRLPAGATDGAKIEDTFFSPDGANVLVLCRRGEVAQLYKAPLKLTAEEKATAKRGVERPAAQPPPRKAAPPNL